MWVHTSGRYRAAALSQLCNANASGPRSRRQQTCCNGSDEEAQPQEKLTRVSLVVTALKSFFLVDAIYLHLHAFIQKHVWPNWWQPHPPSPRGLLLLLLLVISNSSWYDMNLAIYCLICCVYAHTCMTERSRDCASRAVNMHVLCGCFYDSCINLHSFLHDIWCFAIIIIIIFYLIHQQGLAVGLNDSKLQSL